MQRIKVSKAQKGIKEIIKACYPEWKGRKVAVQVATTYAMSNFWDGGSRNYVKAYDLAASKVAEAAPTTANPFRGQAHATVEIPDGVAMVEHSISCGVDCGITIYVNPANMPSMLPAGGAS